MSLLILFLNVPTYSKYNYLQPWESHLLIHVTDIVLHVIQQSIIKKHIYTKLENMYKCFKMEEII